MEIDYLFCIGEGGPTPGSPRALAATSALAVQVVGAGRQSHKKEIFLKIKIQ
jgi:hypothetical protein